MSQIPPKLDLNTSDLVQVGQLTASLRHILSFANKACIVAKHSLEPHYMVWKIINKMTSKNTLSNLAILKVNYDEHGDDFVQNFVPFVAEGLRRQTHDLISLKDLQTTIETSFGIRIPQGALQTILNRAKKKGYVTNSNGALYRNLGTIPDDFEQQSHKTLSIQRSVIDKLVKYAKVSHGHELSEADAEKTLLGYLQEQSLPILQTAIDGKPLDIGIEGVPFHEYILGNFLLHLEEKDPVGFAHIETITKGQMLASLLYVPDLNKISKKFNDLTVFLDTRIVLRTLGLEGSGFQEPCLELINVLQKMGVKIACFRQTFDELHGILGALENALKNPRQLKTRAFPVMEFALSQRWRASDIQLISSELETKLKKLNIYLREKPDHTIPLGVNETKFSEIIAKNVVGQSIEAQRHDLDCCTAIHRLRKGQTKYEFENCGYIFATSNSSLARAAAEFFIEEYERFSIPLCINDHALATLAWVKNPEVSSELSKKMLIADSYAAIRPSRDLWKKYLAEINKQLELGNITDDQFQLLRFNLAARNALLETTHGIADAFTEGTIPEVLERVQKNITKDFEDQLDSQKELTIQKTQELNKFTNHLNALISKVSRLTGKFCSYLVVVAAFTICAIGLFLTLPASVSGVDINLLQNGAQWLKVTIVIFSIATICGLLFGLTFCSMGKRLERTVAGKCERALRKILTAL